MKYSLLITLLPALVFGQTGRHGTETALLRFHDSTRVQANVTSKEPEVFITDSSFEQSFWRGECSFRVHLRSTRQPLDTAVEPVVSTRNGNPRVRIAASGAVHDLYAADSTSLEWEIILARKPDTNLFEYQIETAGLEFYYQPPLTPEEAAAGVTIDDSAIGSYWLEHATRRHNIRRIGENDTTYFRYTTGIVGTIWRPDAWNAAGDTVACSLFVDISAGVLAVTVPQKFLDDTESKSAWPATIDPEFGYHDDGSTTSGNFNGTCRGNAKSADQITTPSDSIYTIDSLYARSRGTDFGWTITVAVYDTTSNNRPNNKLSESVLDGFGTSLQWAKKNVNIELATSTTYTLCIGQVVSGINYRYTNATVGDMSIDLSAPTFNNPWDHNTSDNDRMCLYAVYTSAPAPSTSTGRRRKTLIGDYNEKADAVLSAVDAAADQGSQLISPAD